MMSHKIFAAAVATAALAFLVLPAAPAAQAQVAITSAEAKQLMDLENQLVTLGTSGQRNTPAYTGALSQAKGACASIASKISTITTGSRFGEWDDVTATCRFGPVVYMGASGDAPIPVNGTFDDPDPTRQFLVGLANNPAQTPLTQATFRQQSGWNDTTASANGVAGALKTFLASVVVGLVNVLNSILAAIATAALHLFNLAANQSVNSGEPAVIARAWTVIRDFMNIVFIFGIIVIALGTILRSGKYNPRLLVKLVIMALLINFSLVIGRAMIGFSDMLIQTLNPGNGITAYSDFIWDAFITGDKGISGFFGLDSPASVAVGKTVLSFISLVILAITLVAVAGLMFVRMVGLWMLLVLSPAAYALSILPQTEGLASRWWQTFTKYLIWGPVCMFFLRVAFVFLAQLANKTYVKEGADSLFLYLLVAGFTYAAFGIAKSTGMIGGDYVAGMVNKYGQQGAKYGARAYGNLFWRGNVAGGAAYAGRRISSTLQGKSADDSVKLAKESYTKYKDKVGGFTARLSNEASLQKQKWVDDPNKAREKLTKKERRRAEIRRNYLKELDDETAKKFSPADFSYLLEQQMETGDKMLNLLENGNNGTKDAILAAFEQGMIKDKTEGGKMSPEEVRVVLEEARKYAWKKSGKKADLLERNPDFMRRDPVTRKVSNLRWQDKNGKLLNPDGTFKDKEFANRLKNGRIKVETRPGIPGEDEDDEETPAPEAPAAGA